MTNNSILHKTITWLTVIGLALTIAGVIWAAATQNNRLENVCSEQADIKPKVEAHEKSINTIEAKMEYIIKTLDEIKRTVNRNDRTVRDSGSARNSDNQ